MKAIVILLVVALGLAVMGCAQPGPRGGTSDRASANAGEGQSSGAGSSEPDYRQILSDPGPF